MNGGPSLQGALWTGNSQLATKNQLISSINGIYADLQDLSGFQFQNLEVSTITVKNWISAPTMYVSSLYAQSIDLSGIVLDPSGVLILTDLSANRCSISFVSMSTLQFTYNMNNSLNISFDLGLGEAVGGALAGLGALVGGAAIGIGTAIGGVAQGIATLIAGRPQNFITNNTYETINFTSQLQISTIGYAQPIYSTIFRTVSSISANEVPGREIFTSTFFYPGQICIRTASDPFNLISGDSNLATSTLQSFGQWVPLAGLEPEDIVANSVSTNTISTGQIFADLGYIDDFQARRAGIQTLTSETITIPDATPGPGPNISMGYAAPLNFTLGSLGSANIQGNVNYMWIQSDQNIVFSKTGSPNTTPISGSIELGGGGESVLNFSTVNGNSLFATNATIQNLLVTNFSTINSNSQVNVLSTSVVEADIILANFANISSIAPFKFTSSILGNPTGPFDITRNDSVISTTYTQISSLQQNILSYSLNTQVQDQASFNIGDNPGIGLTYEVTPANIEQWASTQLIFNGYQGPGGIDLGWVAQWGVSPGDTQGAAPGGATFDVLYQPNPLGGQAPFYLTEQSNRAYPVGLSTFYQQTLNPPPAPVTFSARMTLPPVVGGSRTGWWQMTTPCPPPYSSSNNNTFQIFQDINDTYITATDRLHLQAGDLFLDGTLNLSNITANSITATNGNFQTVSTAFIQVSTLNTELLNVNPLNGGIFANYTKSGISYNNPPFGTQPFVASFINNSPDYLPIYNLIADVFGSNSFDSYNVSNWNNTVWNNVESNSLGVPRVFLGDVQNSLGTYGGYFYINNGAIGVPGALPIYTIGASGSNLLGVIAAGTYGKISTMNGTTWTLTSNVPNPQGTTGGSYSNILTVNQATTQTNITNTQNLLLQAPLTTLTTNSFFLYADQIRVNSHSRGNYPASGLPSYPIGIESQVYNDQDMKWEFVGGAYNWQTDATNVVYNVTGKIYYDINAWICTFVTNTLRTKESFILEYDTRPAVIAIGGTSAGYCWGYSRHYEVNTTVGGPGNTGTYSYVGVMAYPRNYMNYV